MPYDFSPVRDRHTAIPGAVEGYELAPRTGKGLWSIVSPTGTVTNLNTLGLQVLAYTGAGMPPVENITTQLGVLGGSYLQRTVSRPRTIVLSCIAQGLTFAQVQQIKNKIIVQVAPYNSLQTSKVLKLRYQLVNYCGDLIGTALEVGVTYAGDLTGSSTNLYQDRFDLQFVEFAPPGIKELTTIQPSLSFNTTRTSTQGVRYKSATTGEWKFISLSGPRAVYYDLNGELWYGSSTTVTNRSASTSQAVNGAVNSIVSDQNNIIFVGGAFTTPQPYIMAYSGGSWGALFLLSGTPINGIVRGMAFDNAGALYLVGDFTTPQSGFAKYNYGTYGSSGSWGTTLPISGGVGNAIVRGLDGNMYIATSNNSIRKWDVAAGTLTIIGTTNVAPSSLAVLPDGRIVAGGSFSTITGITGGAISAVGVAVYNYSSWQPLGNGLGPSGSISVTGLAVNKITGDLYATGYFYQSGSTSLPFGFARFNGSNWVPGDITNTYASINRGAIATRSSDGEIALISDFANQDLSNSTLNTLTYTGTADVFPQIKFTGPGVLWDITNYTTGKTLYFNNYTMLTGETALYTHDPAGGITFTSSFFGNILGKILPGSDTTSFSLVPGTNYILPYITGGAGATKVELIYQNTHWSFEAGAPA